ncbi:MAG: DegT/DnrJ/EryC1/StrS family aminotransferase, partial [Candidatus Thermoplasmatota archaeon]
MTIPVARPNLGDEEKRAVLEVLDSGILAQGPRVKAFEEAFAAYVGRKHAVAVCNGTAALHVALLAQGIGKGQEVLVPPLTFFASAATVLQCGARVRFADIEEDTYNLDPGKAKRALTAKSKAIMPVHLFGQTATMDPIRELAAERDLVVIEDACQAHGAEYKGRKAGALGHTACFSFYPTKNMTTTEGGWIVPAAAAVADRCRMLRDQGQGAKYVPDGVGFNLRMTEVCAAIGLVQLRRLDGFVQRRRETAHYLTEHLQDVKGLALPAERPDRIHSFYQYIVRATPKFPMSRDDLVKFLTDRGVGSRPSYPVPLYEQKALAGM